jgi:hypothetical protein
MICRQRGGTAGFPDRDHLSIESREALTTIIGPKLADETLTSIARKFSMLEDGEYSAWFKTPAAQGTGIVILEAGQITGQDTVIAYSGSYEQDGDRFTAVVRGRRYCEGQPSVFGIDEFELKLVGRSSGTLVGCTGTSEQAPGIMFEATLIRSRAQSPTKPVSELRPPSRFDAIKFPKARSR